MYQLTNDSTVVRRPDDGALFSLTDPFGAVQTQYAAWLAAGNTPQPAPVAPLASVKSDAVSKIDRDADAIRVAVIGERATEYQTAYDEATAFKAAGYSGTVPPTVQSWVDAKAAGGVTWAAQQAADDILATAAAWTSAQYAIRANRLKAKEQAKAAADAAGVSAALAAWATFPSAIRAQPGV